MACRAYRGEHDHHLADGGRARRVCSLEMGEKTGESAKPGFGQSHSQTHSRDPLFFEKCQSRFHEDRSKGAGGPAPASNAWARGQRVPTQNQSQPAGQRGADGIPADYMMNQATKEFVAQLYHLSTTDLVPEMKHLYTNRWEELSNMYYADCAWPSEDSIAGLCDGSQLFQLLYKGCVCHLYGIKRAGVLERVASFEHYCKLFDFVLDHGLTTCFQSNGFLI